jgi:hypothetical protein
MWRTVAGRAPASRAGRLVRAGVHNGGGGPARETTTTTTTATTTSTQHTHVSSSSSLVAAFRCSLPRCHAAPPSSLTYPRGCHDDANDDARTDANVDENNKNKSETAIKREAKKKDKDKYNSMKRSMVANPNVRDVDAITDYNRLTGIAIDAPGEAGDQTEKEPEGGGDKPLGYGVGVVVVQFYDAADVKCQQIIPTVDELVGKYANHERGGAEYKLNPADP